ncbi:MAG: type IV secretion system protein [Treponema sp.]|jgi:type IV secretion system protein VirB5|nr:type IV secretion system protein [Treponema sp.]
MNTQTGSNNPYAAAREEWLERYGSYIKRAAQWRMAAFLCLAALLISIFGNVFQLQQQKIVPYIIEVDSTGNSRAVARVEIGQTPERVIQAEIVNFIRDWRTVTADVELQRKMIERLSYFSAGSAKGFLREWYAQNNPHELSQKRLISVEPKGLPLAVSASSYRVEWTEITRSHAGMETDRQTYEATLGIQINPPSSDAVIMRNPSGVYIISLSIAKVLRQQ